MGQVASASVLGAAAIATAGLLQAPPAQAQVAYGSYVGVGGAVGLTNDAATGRGNNFSGVLAGRYRFLTMPISLRGQAFLFGGNFAVVPTVSYDVPLNWNLDAYLGAGVSFAGGGDTPSPVGNQTAFVLQPGVDYMFPNSNLVAFGNAIFAFDAYREGSNMAISVQGGVGIQF
ncbi:MAG: hypothetical protein ICV77_16615 [Cyanobacteria bacterium Co-bin8]|nr:hypothetical protein [Cyanobacteria bacterium Co-bin8]